MISAPDPSVVDDGVVAVDDQTIDRLACELPADAEEDILKRDRIAGVAGGVPRRSDNQLGGCRSGASIEENTLDPNTIDVAHLHRNDTIVIDDGRIADTQD